MRRRPGLSFALGMLALVLSGCSDLPDAMPQGYERVGDTVAVRADGVEFGPMFHAIPVAELFEDGDYAIYILSADCKGRAARTGGTRFSSDGVIGAEIEAVTWGAAAQLSTLQLAVDHLCELAKTGRVVDNPDDRNKVLALLYGDPDGQGESSWQGPSAADEEKITTRRVKVLKTGRFVEGGRQLAYVITGAYDPECTARACSGGILGAALFEQVEDRWQLRSHDPHVDVIGEQGKLPLPEYIQVLTAAGQPPLLAIESRSMHFGEGGGSIDVFGVVADHLKKVLSTSGWADNTGANDCTDRGECVDVETTMAVGRPGGAWPEIIAHQTGMTKTDGEQTRIDERTTYRFDGKGAYVEASKIANNTPIVKATSAQADEITKMRPVVIDAVRAAWTADAAFAAAEITELELQPESDAVYAGVLGVRKDGNDRTFRMRIEVRPDSQYAWSFVKD